MSALDERHAVERWIGARRIIIPTAAVVLAGEVAAAWFVYFSQSDAGAWILILIVFAMPWPTAALAGGLGFGCVALWRNADLRSRANLALVAAGTVVVLPALAVVAWFSTALFS